MLKQADVRGYGINKKTKAAFLLGSSALAIGTSLALPQAAHGNTIFSASTSSPVNINTAQGTVVVNSGVTLSGVYTAMSITAAIGTLTNNGYVGGSYSGINNQQTSIGTLANTGIIRGTELGISNNNATITNLVNSGTILGATIGSTIPSGVGVYNDGVIGTLTNANTGLIQGWQYAIQNLNGTGTGAISGSIGLISNSGTIAGNIQNDNTTDLTIAGGSGTTIGTLTGYTIGNLGVISNTGGNVVLSTGNILLNDNVTVTGHTLSNTGAAVTLTTLVSVTGNYNQSAGTLVVQNGGKLAVSGSATVGGTVVATLNATSNYLATGGSVTTLVAGGTGSNYSSVVVNTIGLSPTVVSASGAISGINLILSVANDYIGGTLASIGNTGVLAPTGSISAVYVAGTGRLGTLVNAATGTISGFYAVRVSIGGSIGGITNSGLISGNSGGAGGIFATLGASIGTITNNATGTIMSAALAALNDPGGVIGTITNAGLVTHTSTGIDIFVAGTISQVNNSGTIRNQSTTYGAVYVGGTTTLTSGTLTTLSNSGLIQNASASGTGTVAAILVDGYTSGGTTLYSTLGTLLNNATGIISARTAIRISSLGTIGTLVNSGTIMGSITNLAARDLSITGGSGTTVGTFTGLTGTVGTINNTLSNLVFGDGTVRSNILLNDAIVATGRTVLNNSANLSFGSQSVATIAGTFVQGSLGTLSLGTTQLSISGAASIAGTVLGAFDTSVNHTPGEGITLVTADGGLSLSNGTLTGVVRASGTGINAGASISGNSLLAQVQNYYIATTYGTVTNTGNLTSTSAVYVASGASLGAVSNSGTIQGNIVNLSANDLTLLGGSAGTYGTYTGLSGTATGSIQNSLSNVTLAGNVLLNDGVNVGGTTHAVVADGASVLLNAAINVTGNYSQTGGTLLEAGGGGELIVSGAAVLSGVSYSVVGATSAYHYLIGPAGLTPIVAGGAGSSYTSITYSSGIAGLTLGGYTQGNSLWGTVLNDYVGDSLASIAVANGTTLSSPSVQTLIYISSAGTLGTLSNSGVIQGNIVNNGSAALNLVGGASGTVGTFTGAGGTLGTITNTLSNVVVANGNVRIADQVNVGSGLLYVTNGTLSVAPGVTVSGNYRQDNPNGTLSLGVGEKLIVTGSATISDGYIQVGSFDGLTNHVAGETTTLVQAGAASFYTLTSAVQGVPVVYSTVDGLGVAGTQVGNNLLASIQNDYFGTSTASFTQAGTIVLGTYNATQYVPNAALFVAGTASIGTLTNIGVLDAEASDGYGIFLASSGTLVASIGTLVNSGTIAGRVGIGNFSGVIGTIDNSGLIQDSLPNSGIYNGNTITLVNNQASGTIAGGYGIYNSGLLSTIANAGLITGTASNGSSGAAGVVNYATIGTLTNSGTIAASGTISAYTYNVIAGVQNGGTITTLSNSGVITATGTISDPTGTMSNGHHLVAGIANSGTLGTLVNAAGGTIAASGTISAHTYNVIAGVQNQGSITTLSNSGVIAVNGIITNSIGTGYNAVAAIANVGGTIDALTNSGSISGTLAGGVMVLNSRAYHVALFNSGTIGTLTNNTGAVIRDDYTGIANYAGGTIAGLTNDGTITGDARSGIHNEGFIATLTNNGLISSGSTGIWSGSVATIGTLVNNGVIHGDNLGYVNRPLGVLGTLVNAAGATLSGASTAINNAGSIGLISNSGTIVGNGSTGLVNLASGTIGTVLNAVGGVIGGGSTGIFNAGTIGTLVNSGLINAARALSNSGALLGGIANSGTIAGNITNAAASALTISGGTGATVGTLTGVSTGLGSADQGLISITSAGLVFSSGNLLLNDNITATGQTVTNAGASLRLANSVTVTGAYAQGSIGTLVLASGAVLSVTSAANITVGTVTSAGFNATGNYVAGGSNVTLVVGGTGSSYDASVVAGGGITGLGLTGSVAGNNLLAVVGNDYVGGSQATLSNTGSLTYNSASTGAVYVASTGTLGTLANSGTIAGSIAVQVASGGTLGVLSDTGLIQGGIVNLASRVLTISGGSGTTVGTLTGLSGLGTITSTLANVLLASGNLLLNDQVNVGTGTLVNAASATVTGNVSVTGNFSQSTGTLVIRNGGGELFVSGAATMSGGTVLATNVPGTMNATAGQVSTALVAAGAASSYTNLTYGVDVTGLEVTGTNIANTLYLQALNDYVGGSQATLSNTGTISANNAVYVAATGTLGTLFNSGTLLGASAALSNLGSLTSILNGTLGTAVSPGLMAGAVGIANAGYLGTLTNYATILGTTGAAVDNQGTLFGLGNAGTMTGVTAGLNNAGSMTIVQNAGLVSGSIGVNNTGTISALGNIGFGTLLGSIVGSATGIRNSGSGVIGTLANAGLISGVTAIYNAATATLGTIANSGTIAGNITNLSSADLVLVGSGGTLTGGTISNTSSNVVFAGGSQLLADQLNVGSHTVVNSGASLGLGGTVTVTGSYSQVSGTLSVTPGTSQLVVTGAASITGGTVLASLSATANYLVGSAYTLVQGGAGSSYTGATATVSGVAGLSAAASISGNTFLLSVSNDYVGGSIGTLSNTGTLSAATAVYIASTGTLGTLANTGVIQGNVINNSATGLTIAGGTGATVGTLTGQSGQGTITSTLANVVLASGNLVLNDAINVGTGTLVNGGANVLLTSIVSVTGGYSQSAGTLGLGASQLVVSGAASITGGTVTASLSSTANYLAGVASSTTLVAGGAGSDYSGAAVAVGNVAGLAVGGTTSGTNLVVLGLNDYVGGSLASIANTGSISADYAVYVAATGTLGTLFNSGTLLGASAALSNLGSITSILNGTLGTAVSPGLMAGAVGIANAGYLGTLTNYATILGTTGAAVDNQGTLYGLGNAGTMTGVTAGLNNAGSMTIVQNAGLVSGSIGVNNTGTISALGNIGFGTLLGSIVGSATGIRNSGSGVIGTLANAGLISGVTAIYNAATATLGTIANSGTIAGNITNLSSADLVLAGSGGTLTGGTISNTSSNVVFAGGSQLLADQLNVGSHTVVNSGASLGLGGTVTVTGNYSQVSGTLSVNPGVSRLVVTGAASITGGTVLASLSATGVYLVGSAYTLVQGGAGSSYTGATAAVAGVAGLGAAGSISGNTFLLSVNNDYVGGSIGTLSNTGTLSAATAVYIASTGTLGVLANSGLIQGNITNNSANALTITGGTGTTVGTLTGPSGQGTITSTLASVVLASGALLLNDAVNVGAGTLANSGASVLLASIVSVTGNYSQASGVLALNTGSELVVSGAASITGGTVAASLSSGSHYLAGQTVDLVQGSTLSSYTGAAAQILGAHVGATLGNTVVSLGEGSGGGSGSLVSLLRAVLTSDYVGDSLAGITNTGTLGSNATAGVYVASTGTLGTLSNSGTVLGSSAAVSNLGSITSILNGTLGTAVSPGLMAGAVGIANAGYLGTLTSYGTILGTTGAAVDNQGTLFGLGNAGTMTGVTAGLNNAGSMTIVQNAGLVSGSIGVNNTGTIVALGNIGFGTLLGTITGSAIGISNSGSGVIGTLANAGLISGVTAIYNAATASLGTIANSGTIAGNITNLSSGDLVLAGSGGTLTGGTISNTASNVVFAGGAQVVGDAISVGSHTVVNSGASLVLAGTLSITGNYSQASGTLVLGTYAAVVSGVASISGGTVSTSVDPTLNYIVGSSTGVVLVQGGAGSSYSGVSVTSTVTGLTLGSGVATVGSNVDLVLAASNDYIGGTLGTLNNSGTIAGVLTAAYIASAGSIGTLSNSGVLSGSRYGIDNLGSIGLVSNSGTATGVIGLYNQGVIGTVLNSGSLLDEPEINAAGLNNAGLIGAVINQGTGTISSVFYGLYNSGSIASVDNSGLISATNTVSGQALANVGTIASLSNGGVITGVTALYTSGSIGTIANSGTIAGAVVNTSANALTFTGGTGTVTGTLTGLAGAQGTITSTGANVVLASGNILLNDAVNVGTGTLVNSGASVLLTSVVSVTGNYAQSDGTLAMGIGSGTAGELLVSGDAAFSGGTVAVTALTGSNLIAGQSYTIAEVGGTLTTSNLAAAATGFSATLGTGTNGTSTDLLLTLLSDYVSGTLGTLTNSGTINAPTAVMITSAGSLGTLANSGTIIGNVVNASANDLVITGGTGGTVGSFSGGTIHNSLSNLTFASGAVSLGDAIDVSGHTVSNSGASLTLANDVSVTGAYSQSAGTLSVAGHVLSVSGAAVVTGGLVDAGLSGTANYLVGDGVTLIQGGEGSSYTGATVTSGLTGLDATGTTSGTNLLAVAANDYIGGAYGTLAITGTLANTAGGATALYIARTGTLGALANSGTIAGNITNLSSGDLSITGGSGSVVGVFTGGTIANTGANVVFAGGAVALGDAIDVGGTHTVSNIGASLNLTNDVAVSGTYAQSAGTLTVGGHVLTVSGPALVSGGTVSAGLASVGNYLVGDSVTMITGGAGSSYTGATVTSGLTGLDATGTTSGTSLLAVAANDYIGASYGTLVVTGTLGNTAGGLSALYIASTGTLGALANSGTIVGSITNLSSGDLSITGGSNGTVGLFSGGTISNTSANVVFAAGAVSLADAINVASHTVGNIGANIGLAQDVAITGNYSQSAGTLSANGHVLSVSGAASVTGGLVNAGLSGTANYIVGDSITLIQGGAGSSYAGATVTSGVTGLSATGVTSGTSLLAAAANDYIGASLDTLNVTGVVSSPTALYIAATGTLGTLANSGTLAGNITNLSAGDLVINGGTDAAPGTLTGYNGSVGTISNTLSNVRFTGGVQLLNDSIDVGSHTVFNSGATLLVNNAINIAGSYSQSAGSLVIGVTSQTNYGNLVISGSAAFTGGSIALQGVGSGAGALQAGTYTIASANGLNLSGLSFSATGYTVTSNLVTVGGTTELVLKVAGAATNYTSVGNAQGGAAVGTGSALDRIAALAGNSITTNTQLAAFQQQVLAPLATLTPTAQRTAVAQLSPSQLTPQLTATSVTPTTTAISQHQDQVAGLMDGDGKGLAAGSDGRTGVIWGEVVGAGVLRGTTTEAAGYRASSAGIVLGADWFANSELMAGMAFSWINSASVGQGVMAGSLTRVGSYQLTAYSVWRPDWSDQRLSVEGQLGFGYNHFDQRRDIAFLGARANANYGGEQYLGKVTVGYDLPKQGALTFTPQYSLRAVRLTNHGYQERDAGPANLTVDPLGTTALTQELGVKVTTDVHTGLGTFMPDLKVAWLHDFKDGPIPTTGVLAGVAFASTTGRINTDGLALNLGTTLDQGGGFKLRLEYNGEYRRDYQSHGGVLRASWDF